MLRLFNSFTRSNNAANSSNPHFQNGTVPQDDPEDLMDYASGLRTTLTSAQREVLNQLKSRIESGGFTHVFSMCNDEAFLLRFLRARKFDLVKTSKMLQANLEWRQSFNMDRLASEERFDFVAEMYKIYPRGYHGIDKRGRPVYIERFGQLELSKILEIAEEQDLVRQYIQDYEFLCQVILPSCTVKAGRPIERTLSIMDLHGLHMSNFNSTTRRYMRHIVSLSQDNYPDVLGEMFIINVPAIFQLIWSFIKAFIDEDTASKISVYTSSDNWKAKLLEKVDASQLPTVLGGTRSTTGELSDSCYGPWTDPEILKIVHSKYPQNPPNLYRLAFRNLPNEDVDRITHNITSLAPSCETLESTDVESESNSHNWQKSVDL